MSNPTSAARRTAHREPEKALTGLDAWVHRRSGKYYRRAAVLSGLLAEAQRIDALGKALQGISDARLRERLHEFHAVFRRGGRTLQQEQVLHEAMACIREAATRQLGMRPFVVQLAGALALHRGFLAEMATGEGKTLTAALAATLTGWSGRPCHVITVNDYLAERDATRMGLLYKYCGLRAGYVIGPMEAPERRRGYDADITYTTSKEVVADFLRDRLQLGHLHQANRRHIERMLDPAAVPDHRLVMRGLHTAIIDEADSVLIDEAVTPLIISRAMHNPDLEEACRQASVLALDFTLGTDYRILAQEKHIEFLPTGRRKLETCGSDLPGIWRAPHRCEELLRQALTARELFKRDQQYVVVDGEVVIVDEFTGRMMPGRTWREGLHQAVEAQEGVPVSAPSETLARISFQRYFQLYEKLSGMTGTAAEAGDELWHTYRLAVISIPTNRPCIRIEQPAKIFADGATKWDAVVDCIMALHVRGIPVLVGTRHISASEEVARRLMERGVEYQLLHAIHHKEEAQIVARAGLAGTITIATNMAGRGTDILLGQGVAEMGGLRVITTERHEARRIDRQLFGRCARQGDPGEVYRFVSLEDELVCRYVPDFILRCLRHQLQRKHAVARYGALLCFQVAQTIAQRQAFLQRRQVLRTDTWIDEALSFSGRSKYS